MLRDRGVQNWARLRYVPKSFKPLEGDRGRIESLTVYINPGCLLVKATRVSLITSSAISVVTVSTIIYACYTLFPFRDLKRWKGEKAYTARDRGVIAPLTSSLISFFISFFLSLFLFIYSFICSFSRPSLVLFVAQPCANGRKKRLSFGGEHSVKKIKQN